jgi:Gas vesicle protein
VSDGFQQREIAIVDLLDRVLATGAVITGDVTISLADIDLIRLDLRLLLASVASIDTGGRSTLTLENPGGQPHRALHAGSEPEPQRRPRARSGTR